MNPNEPVPLDEAPPCPEHLETLAKVEWGRMADKLHRIGLLTEIDGTALAMYCVAYGRWVQALEHVKTEEPVLLSENGGKYQNPWLAVSNKAFDQMAKLLVEFGMTPSSRSRVSVKKDNTATKKGRFFGVSKA